jgi:hypothetical protein
LDFSTCSCIHNVKDFEVWNVGSTSGRGFGLYEVEVYQGGPTEVGIEFYMFNMRVDHPNFRWQAGWGWSVTWHGSLVIGTSPSGTFYTAGSGNTAWTTSNAFTEFEAIQHNEFQPYVWQDCFPLCQSDEITVIINDTDRNQTASYTFLRSDDGPVQVPTRVPFFTAWAGCFNVAANDCDADFDPGHTYTSGAGTMDLSYTFIGSASNIQAGPRSRTNPTMFATVQYAVSNQDEGSYTSYGVSVNTSQSNAWMLCASNQVNSTCVDITLNFTTGGKTSGGSSTPIGGGNGTQSSCGTLDPLCGLRQLFDIGANFLLETMEDGVGSLREAILSKQPFNFMVRAADGIGVQLAAASAAVTATDDCPGFTITIPWSGIMPDAIRPSGLTDIEFDILKCADFEPIVGTKWYQAIRNAMDPALYLLFAWKQIQRFRPRPTMNG